MTTESEAPLRIIPLGGLGEIGMNMLVFEYAQKILLIDCGLMFPEDYMLGVDIVIPDFSYLENREKDIMALILTHGHEDHIGAVPYLLKNFRMPIYGTRLTLELVAEKCREQRIENADMHVVQPKDQIEIGGFKIEFVHVSHSIMDGVALGIETPVGLIVHSGDFKLDFSPMADQTTDIKTLASFGERGVLCLLSDSTNIEQEGYTLTEAEVGRAIEDIFRESRGRIIITLFASNIARIQQVFEIAARFGRKVGLSGKSMVSTVNIARRLGYLKVKPSQIFELGNLPRYPKNKVVLLTTGSQGEPMSVLTRIAVGMHKHIKITPGDTVILSSKFIPGNEASITGLINELYDRGAEVVYEKIREIHSSGHAHREELKLMLKMIQPTYFIPIHGESRHLIQHANLAMDMGVKSRNLLLARDGDIIEFSNSRGQKNGKIRIGRVLIDGKGVGDVGNIVLTDRRLLSEGGTVTCAIAYREKDGSIVGEPRLQSKGLVYEPDYSELFDEAKKIAIESFQRIMQEGDVNEQESRDQFTRDLRRFFYKTIRRRPIVIPVFIRI